MEKKSRFTMSEEHMKFIDEEIEKEKDLDLNDKKKMIKLKKKIFNIFANNYSNYCGSDSYATCFNRFSKMMNNNFFSNNPINSEKLFEIIFEFLGTKHGNVQRNKTTKEPLSYLSFRYLATEYNKKEEKKINSKQIQNFLSTLHINNKNKSKDEYIFKDEYKIFMKKLSELNVEKSEIKKKECKKELLKIIGNQKKEIIYEDDVGEEELDVGEEELDVVDEETYNSPSKLKGDIPESPGFFASLWNFFSPTTHKTPPHPDSKDSIGTFTLPSDTSPSDLKPVRSSKKLLTFTPSPKNNKRQRDEPPVLEPPPEPQRYKRQRTSDGKRKKSSRKKSSRNKSSR